MNDVYPIIIIPDGFDKVKKSEPKIVFDKPEPIKPERNKVVRPNMPDSPSYKFYFVLFIIAGIICVNTDNGPIGIGWVLIIIGIISFFVSNNKYQSDKSYYDDQMTLYRNKLKEYEKDRRDGDRIYNEKLSQYNIDLENYKRDIVFVESKFNQNNTSEFKERYSHKVLKKWLEYSIKPKKYDGYIFRSKVSHQFQSNCATHSGESEPPLI